MVQNWVGYRWLSETYNVAPVQGFPISSRIGKSRSRDTNNGVAIITFTEATRPGSTPADHLAFALKHEGVNLEFLARLFSVLPKEVLEEWINREPSGQYARRTGFLYEWLTGKEMLFEGVLVGNYVSALPEDDYLTRPDPVNSSRWRVRNNLPGTPDYCPTVRRTEAVKAAEAYDVTEKLHQLEAKFGADMLLRSAVWLTIKESRASFKIEHEESESSRIRRFASVMERYLGTAENPLEDDFLNLIQSEILGEKALRIGIRKSPVFVGESSEFTEIVHYIAPHWNSLAPMLNGLREFATTTTGRSAIVRAAVLSFGFVYIHPMADGNGRISRFLVNDTLRRDGAAPAPFLLPISATITKTIANRVAYDRALEHYSKPFMAKYQSDSTFGPLIKCEDGVTTNFYFSAYADASFAWAFPDLTHQVEYLTEVIRETLESEMEQEAQFLTDLYQTRERVKEIFEAPDSELDRIIRSVQTNGGISGKLRREFPILEDETIAKDLLRALNGIEAV